MRRIAVVAAALALSACQGQGSRAEVEQAVQTYIARVCEAYRKSDASLVDPLVNDAQGLKVTGLIGVKWDAGVALDAKLLHLEFTKVERDGKGWLAETRERWYYRDVKLGTDQQVGEDSTDLYAMRYRFSRKDGKYVLEDLEFLDPPVVGRKVAPMPTDPRVLHGLDSPTAPGEAPGGVLPGGGILQQPGEEPPPGHPAVPGGMPPPGHPPMPGQTPPPGHPPVPPAGK